jgi:hypothetical protein
MLSILDDQHSALNVAARGVPSLPAQTIQEVVPDALRVF